MAPTEAPTHPANELATEDGRHAEKLRRAAEFQALMDADAAVIDLREVAEEPSVA